jgi:formylglycine-generating enzyme required for sulfatase activity/uncharacterized caspase-like protein
MRDRAITRIAPALLLAALVAAPALAQNETTRGQKYALLVGVREYKTPTLRTLKYSERDIEELAKVLLDAGFSEQNMRVLTQERTAKGLRYLPSSENIRTELSRMLKLVELAGDTASIVIVALAGHGIMDPKAEKSYFCPADTSALNLSPEDPALIDLGGLYDQLKASPAGFKLMLVDACRNDPLSPKRSTRPVVDLVSVTRPLKKRPPGGVAALFSCSEGQVAYEDDDLKHGVFFHFVIEGLKGKADEDSGNRDGKVTLGELAGYIGTEVYKFVDRTRNDEQLPEYLFKANSINLVDLAARKSLSRSLADSIGMRLALIPAGEFMMGSSDDDDDADDDETPRHRVRITRPFYLGTTEVAVGQFRRFVAATGHRTEAELDGRGGHGWNESRSKFEVDPKYTWRNPGFPQTDEHPVTNVSWNDAVAFCEWLSAKEGKVYRLPTEAEWEYACRAGTTTRYTSGADPETLVSVGNVADGTARTRFPQWTTIASRDGQLFTAPVGHFRANAWGLYDMHGNVGEWCRDGYDGRYYQESPGNDPPGPAQPLRRVYRGGSWADDPRYARSARRVGVNPDYFYYDLGFRVTRIP